MPNRQSPGQEGSVLLPRRWVIERTFGWLNRWRRLARDCEQNPRSSQSWLYLTMIGLRLRHLHP